MEVSNLRCNDCKFYKANADMDKVESTCKRINHKTVKFAVPWFKSYDCDFGTICSDFEPNPNYPALVKEWNELGGFQKWWQLWVEQWLPYQKIDKYVYFTLNGDTSIRYGVWLMDYVTGNMYNEDGSLKAETKQYYVRCKKSKSHPIGYKLVEENIKEYDNEQ